MWLILNTLIKMIILYYRITLNLLFLISIIRKHPWHFSNSGYMWLRIIWMKLGNNMIYRTSLSWPLWCLAHSSMLHTRNHTTCSTLIYYSRLISQIGISKPSFISHHYTQWSHALDISGVSTNGIPVKTCVTPRPISETSGWTHVNILFKVNNQNESFKTKN